MYQQMAQLDNVELEVLYCSDQGVSEKKDEQFEQIFQWNIPLLEGYPHRFFRNYSPRPGLSGFWGLQNWGIIRHLFLAPKSILVVNGWQFFIYIAAIIAGRLAGHTVCLRGESPLKKELSLPDNKRWVKKFLLGQILFRIPHHFLYIGKQNMAFYSYMGVKEKQLVFSPYSIDNQRFQAFYPTDKNTRNDIRTALHLPPDHNIILYSGKFMAKKRPLDLLQAWYKMDTNNSTLVFMGEGALRGKMEAFIAEHQINNVVITGFVNQAEIPLYYAAADIYVMLSDSDETWGLSTNEAMNLRLPLVLSDAIGCSSDLVEDGVNGFCFTLGDIEDLKVKLQKLMDNFDFRHTAGLRSLEIVNQYSYKTIINNLLSLQP